MIWFLIATILAIVLSGCAIFQNITGPHEGQYIYTRKTTYLGAAVRVVPIWIDKNFGESDKIAMDDAIDAWNYALNGFMVLQVVDTQFDMEIPKLVERVKSNGWLFMKIDSNNPMIPTNDKGYWTIGFVERLGGNHLYLVRDRLENESIFGVTLHEIGHLLGASHRGDRLMHPHFGHARFRCIDMRTIERVADYNHLPMDRLNYCLDTDGHVVSDGDIDPIICPN